MPNKLKLVQTSDHRVMDEKTPTSEELVKKLQLLEEEQAHLMQEVFLFRDSSYSYAQQECQRAHTVPPQHTRLFSSEPQRRLCSGGAGRPPSLNLSFGDWQYFNILQSLGQSVYAFDLSGRIIYWSKTAGNLYGYSVDEALGQNVVELLAAPQALTAGYNIFHHVAKGESWIGQFPVMNKLAEIFPALVTCTPFYDDKGTFIGVICVSSDLGLYQENRIPMFTRSHSSSGYPTASVASEIGVDTQRPVQNGIASKFTNFASKMRNRVKSSFKAGIDNLDYRLKGGDSQFHHGEEGDSSGACTPRRDVSSSPVGVFAKLKEKIPGKPSGDLADQSEGKRPMHKIISSEAEAWIGKKGMSWPWKEKDQEGLEARNTDIIWAWLHSYQESDLIPQKSNYGLEPEDQANEYNQSVTNEVSASWDITFNVYSTSSASNSGSNNSSLVNKVEVDSDCLDYEVIRKDMLIGERIGRGSTGTVYRGLWHGSDVAIKIFVKQEYPDDVLRSFRQEVSVMKKLQHPNIFLVMGAVTSPDRLCIVTEFLPWGSLYQLLHKTKSKLDWRRSLEMALDIAQGMNYLHHFNPPIIHQNLKSANLLVDKNWTVKVGGFGLSRLKHERFIFTSQKGAPQWMAPEVLRSKSSDEKSDVYSYGVILWELTTGKIPWDDLNAMQVIGAVGYLNQRLEIPKDVDPQWVSIIESCWHSDPAGRPTFQELLQKLKVLQRQHT